ncbi:MAG: hypothetical protein WCQ87_01535 [Parabacteroides sp.]
MMFEIYRKTRFFFLFSVSKRDDKFDDFLVAAHGRASFLISNMPLPWGRLYS